MLVIGVQGNFEEAKEIIFSASKVGAAVEFRFDLMEELDLSLIGELRDLSPFPVIFTLRKKSHGGKFKGSEKEREKKLLRLLTLKPDYVDVEYGSDFFDKIHPEIGLIVSYHELHRTPKHLEEILEQMKRIPATFYKIVTFAHSSLDALRMLSFSRQHKNVVGMCMGECGAITRILSPVVENSWTYAYLEKETAFGQCPVSELMTIYNYHRLNRSTTIYALIGDPIDQSIGHLFHNEIFKTSKKECVYVKISLKPFEVPQFFKLIEHLPFMGISVTMPLKEIILPYLSTIDREAKKIGAVNTLIKNQGKWMGTNTDGKGALDALEKRGKVEGKTLLIIGAGGVAKAIATQAFCRGARVIIANRTFKKGEKLAAQVQGIAVPLNQIDRCSYDVIVSAIPIDRLLRLEPVFSAHKVLGLDVRIDAEKTAFLREIEEKKGSVVSGREMYVHQALGQLKAWGIIPREFDFKSTDSKRFHRNLGHAFSGK